MYYLNFRSQILCFSDISNWAFLSKTISEELVLNILLFLLLRFSVVPSFEQSVVLIFEQKKVYVSFGHFVIGWGMGCISKTGGSDELIKMRIALANIAFRELNCVYEKIVRCLK